MMDCFYFWEIHNSYYWASLHILFLGGAVTVPHYFTREVTARLCEVVSGRAVNRSPGAPQSSAKLQSLSHTAFQDESDESVLAVSIQAQSCCIPQPSQGQGWTPTGSLPLLLVQVVVLAVQFEHFSCARAYPLTGEQPTHVTNLIL